MFKRVAIGLLLTVFLLPPVATASPLSNHSSPYLRLHASDPVDWRLLNKPSLQQAKKQQRLIFISSGYFACHWCHVMQQESFQDDSVADVLNDAFVSIKMDREQQPAIDKQLLEFVRRVRGYAGWPLNVILTPDGYPITGFVYLPKDEFIKVLQSVDARWQQEPERMKALAKAAAEALSASQANPDTEQQPLSSKRLMIEVRLQQDDLQGGFGIQAKFPRVPVLLALFDQYEKQPDASLAEFLQLTLDQIASKGLRDHINGGFFRYTTTPDWLNPHYEKMLTDNALLIQLFVEAEQQFPGQGYLQVAAETAAAMIELFYKDGLFRSSISAVDQQGNEGNGYLWTVSELMAALPDEQQQAIALRWFGLDPEKDAGVSRQLISALDQAVLMQQLEISRDALERQQQAIRRQLMSADKPHHALDDKALLGNNALAVSSLLQLAEQLPTDEGSRISEQAVSLLARLIDEFQRDQQWYRQVDGEQPIPAELEDKAYLAQALWNAYQINNDEKYLSRLIEVLAQCWEFYAEGQWRMAQENLLPWQYAAAALPDSALPAPPAIVMELTRAVRSVSEAALADVPLQQAQHRARAAITQDPLSYASYW